ncbi:MAG TPA: tRNA (adenosine(37)-N6)-threonylcarbamoyltransferase complex dimerization subunit type 1 TsaB [Povalibacter sp.]
MKVLAIDTATERCSVALRLDGHLYERSIDTARGHADIVLSLVDEVLKEGSVQLTGLDCIAYGRGPGSFTGVRIAIGVVQGLAFGANLPTVGVSNLAAVAQQVARPGDRILVCMDARMNEVYWGIFVCDPVTGLVSVVSDERVDGPHVVVVDPPPAVLAGTGFAAYPQLVQSFPNVTVHAGVLPSAVQIALLGEALLRAGEAVPAREAQPVYLRDNVAVAKK